MNRFLSLLFIFVSFSCFAWNGKNTQQINEDGLVHKLESVSLYNGFHKEFKNNLVAVLDDDSRWKVHPNHEHTFRNWHMGDRIHIQIRTSFYFTKREHLFELYNHETEETVPVMFVAYSYFPIWVYSVETLALVKNVKKIYLDDYTTWEIKGPSHILDAFQDFTPVYLGVNEKNGSLEYFIITGIEQNVIWTHAYKGEDNDRYYYYW